MQVGKHTYGKQCISQIWGGPATLKIGNFCSIAENCKVFLGGNHRTDWVTTYPFGHINQHIFTNCTGAGHPTTKGDVIIGNDVWIGHSVTIMSGITIGDGAVLAANSHIVKNVEPYSIVGGNPAKHIKYRWSEEIIEQLLKISWWNWDDAKINTALPLLLSTDLEQFCQTYKVS